MRSWFTASVVLTALTWLAWLIVLLRGDVFPERVPIHWNIDVPPDGWVAGADAVWWLLFMPGAMTLLLLLDWLLPRLSPATFQDAAMRSKLDLTLFLAVAFFANLSVLLFVGMLTTQLPIRPFIASFFVFFGLLGWTMLGLKQNGWIGIRTPWTLKSVAVWDRTHDFAAKLWMAMGVFGLLAVLLGAPPVVCVLALVPAGLVPIAASYYFSRTR